MKSSSLFLYIEINTNHTLCGTKRPPVKENDRNTVPISSAINFFLKGQKNNLKKIVKKTPSKRFAYSRFLAVYRTIAVNFPTCSKIEATPQSTVHRLIRNFYLGNRYK